MLSFVCLFCERGEYLFHRNLVEIVVILPDPTPFCICRNLPVDFNYSWLKNRKYVCWEVTKETSLKTEMVLFFYQKGTICET